jgi:hypothetical protein
MKDSNQIDLIVIRLQKEVKFKHKLYANISKDKAQQ